MPEYVRTSSPSEIQTSYSPIGPSTWRVVVTLASPGWRSTTSIEVRSVPRAVWVRSSMRIWSVAKRSSASRMKSNRSARLGEARGEHRHLRPAAAVGEGGQRGGAVPETGGGHRARLYRARVARRGVRARRTPTIIAR